MLLDFSFNDQAESNFSSITDCIKIAQSATSVALLISGIIASDSANIEDGIDRGKKSIN